MSEPFLGEIRVVTFGYAPRGWANCFGQLLPINQNQALFALLGTIYGGNGQTTFGLPDFRGRISIHQGQGPGLSSYVMGQTGGEERHTLNLSELPPHNHTIAVASTTATSNSPQTGDHARPNVNPRMQNLYQTSKNAFAAPTAIQSAGNGGSHENRQPYLALRYVIALQGIFPSQN